MESLLFCLPAPRVRAYQDDEQAGRGATFFIFASSVPGIRIGPALEVAIRTHYHGEALGTMDHAAVHKLQKAVDAAKQAAHQAKMENCDVDDIDEAIEACDQELLRPTPNRNTLTLYMNSVARSLIAVPTAREACGAIDDALRFAGLPATWEL